MFPTTQGLSDLFFKMKFLYPSVCRLVVSLVGRSAKVFLKGGKLNFHTPIVALFVLPWMGSFFGSFTTSSRQFPLFILRQCQFFCNKARLYYQLMNLSGIPSLLAPLPFFPYPFLAPLVWEKEREREREREREV